ncbi:MAG: CaiB/BaiF CoA transferase family protein [Smithellaceae bacterium]
MSKRPSTLQTIQEDTEALILSGIRVLDFSRMLAGPYATRMLADFGAEVIKVQSGRTATGAELNSTAYFSAWNRNKRSVTINMGHPDARNIILRLTALSDIVVENFSPRVLSNWDLSYERLQEAKPDIIMASVSAMGQTGPWRNFTGYGPTFHALSGLTGLSSPDKNAPSGPGHAYADTIIGLYALLGILAALEHRDKTGEGQYIDVSGYEAACTLLGPALLTGVDGPYEEAAGPPDGNADEEFRGCYLCLGNDRWCVIALFDEEDWKTFCAASAMTDLIHDIRFSSAPKRTQNKKELDYLIGKWTGSQSPEQVVRILQEAGIAAGVVQNAEDLAHDPQLKSREFFVKLAHPILGTAVSERPPFHFAGNINPQWRAAPLLGADNDYVFQQLLGFTEDEIRRGMAEGLIR